MEGKGLRDRAPEFDELGAVLLGVSFDSPEDNAAFAEAFGFPFDLLSDADHDVSERFGARRPPDHQYADWPKRISYLIDPSGTVRRAYEVADVATHPQELLDDLRAEQAAQRT
ncbi:MAG: redoxin domain-containing protein [Actinobacteria bacterium]|nr:redoxin domain-containing protein [Actinomycetota bacterium]